MTTPQALFAGAVLIAASIFLTNGMRPAVAMGGGPYQLMHHSNTSANAGVFRLDTSTGEVSYCYLAGANNAPGMTCSLSAH